MVLGVSRGVPAGMAAAVGVSCCDLSSMSACMSDAWISPPDPEPRTLPMSMPCSFASLLARGEICAAGATGDSGTLAAERSSCGTGEIAGETETASATLGTLSPGFKIHAMMWPTAISEPTSPVTSASTPSAEASTSSTALSVSTSRRSSPLRTVSPSFFSQATSLPVSWPISSAGITTLIAIAVGVEKPFGLSLTPHPFCFCGGCEQVHDIRIWRDLGFASCRQWAAHGVVMGARDQQLFGRESGDDFVTCFRHHHLFLNACRATAIGGGPEGLQRNHHPGLDLLWMIE